MSDASAVSAAAMPYLVAAARAGADDTSQDARLGRRILQRLAGSRRGDQLLATWEELRDDPDDGTPAELLRILVRSALTADDPAAYEVGAMLGDAATSGGRFSVHVTGGQGISIGSGNLQYNTFGSGNSADAGPGPSGDRDR